MLLERALDVVFPRRCAGCGAGPWPFCDACRRALAPLEPPWCERCGRPWAVPVSRCRDCPPPPITTARAAFLFAGPARSAVHRLKFTGWRGVGDALAAAMVATGSLPAVDAVTWVPLARRRLAERGFDQAHVLATGVARRLEAPLVGLLRRTVSTGQQARRGGAERRAAMQGAFAPVERSPAPPRVLLVDDVLTTGATASACADALRPNGTCEVHVLAAVRALDGAAGHAYPQAGSHPGLWLPGDPPR